MNRARAGYDRGLNPVFALVWGSLICLSTPARSGDYLPARLNDHATYAGYPMEVARFAEVDKRRMNWRHFSDFAGWGPRWLSSPENSERLYLLDERRRELLTDFDRAPGFTSTIAVTPCNHGQVVIAAKDQALDTPAGAFAHVTRLDLTTSCADAGVTRLWFARDVGLVQWEETTLAGAQTYALSAGLINGISHPGPGGLTVSGEFPGTEAWINTAPMVGERPVSRVRVSLELHNQSDASLTYSFGSSQRYDILLTDATGRVFAQWSADKLFAQVAAVLTLEPGRSIRFSDELELRTLAGEPVPEGDYSLIVRLASQGPDGIRPAAQAPLRVRWAY